MGNSSGRANAKLVPSVKGLKVGKTALYQALAVGQGQAAGPA
jgi:hypothetical protein